MSAIKFGTEGWRAIMAEEFTVANVRLVAQAIAEHVLEEVPRAASPNSAGLGIEARPPTAGGPRPASITMVVGHDTRFLSDHFARAVCEVLAGNGIRSILTQAPVPTAAVSRYVVGKRLPLGIMVTASHNPGIYNGIKIKEAFGGSAIPETVASVERRIGGSPVRRVAFEQALAARLIQRADLLPPFLGGIKAFVDLAAIRRCRFRVLVDSMHGAGGRIIEGLLARGRCRVETLRAERDAWFGGEAPEPIASHLGGLRAAVRRARADVGIANDGDADRLGVIGPGGVWLNPGQVMCVLIEHLLSARQAAGAVVKTVSNTMMINRLAEARGLRLIETPVGFKYVAKLMLEGGVLIGGEESGGIGVQGYLPERDGILNGLLLLEAMAMQRQTLAELLRGLERRYGRWHYGRRDLHLTMAQVDGLFRRLKAAPPDALAGIPVVRVNALDGVKLIGRDESWLLFRRSGTEPIVRIYAETPHNSRLPKLLRFGVSLAGKAREGLRRQRRPEGGADPAL
jgi:phosphomannomutase